jgi:hypothetical protein
VSPIAQLRFRVRSRSRPFAASAVRQATLNRWRSDTCAGSDAPASLWRRRGCFFGRPFISYDRARRVRSHHKNWVAKCCVEHHIVRNLRDRELSGANLNSATTLSDGAPDSDLCTTIYRCERG